MADLRVALRATGYAPEDDVLAQTVNPHAPLSARQWIDRDLDAPDFLLGELFATNSRGLVIGPTGTGKSNFGIAIGAAMADGAPFLHWGAKRSARVLYIDGEMSARVLRGRIAEAAKRHGAAPDNLFLVNRDDYPSLAPLNTEAGQHLIDSLIDQMSIEFVIFDNIQALIGGLMVDEEAWSDTLPWIRTLTRRHVGQLWLHHTGHDATRGFGTKTREWQMDVVALMTDRADKGEFLVDFDLSFTKARERNRDNRADFADARIFINADDRWESSTAPAASRPKAQKLRPEHLKALDYLNDVIADRGEILQRPGTATVKACKIDDWRDYLKQRGLHEGGDAGKKWFQRVRNYLAAASRVTMDGPYVWKVGKP